MGTVDETKLRRHILKALGSSAVLAPFFTITGCSGDKDPPPAAALDILTPSNTGEPAPDPEPAATSQPVPEETAVENAADSAMPELSADDPQASALGYVADATRVDSAEFPRYEAGQMCANCALFLGEQGSPSGPCSIFPGKLVNAGGWCNVFAPKV